MATNEQLKLTIEVAAKNAVRELQATAKEAKKVGEAVEEIDPKAVARSFDAATDMLIADLRASESAVEALGQALGPELRAKIGDAGLDNFIGDLKQTGLTFDQIEQNADEFAASLKKMDSAADSVKNVEGKLKTMGASADQSRSVLANMVGNSAQDVGELGGVSGSAGVMLGQLAEYAADGNIALSSLAKTAGPLAAVGLAVAGFSKLMSLGAENAKVARERVEGLAEALQDVDNTPHDALVDYYADLGKIEVQIDSATDSLAEFGHGIKVFNRSGQELGETLDGDNTRVVDITESLRDAGLTVADWSTLVQASGDKVREWGARAIAAGADQEQVNEIMSAAIAEHEKFATASERAAVFADVFGDALKGNKDAIKAAQGPFGKFIDQTLDYVDAQQKAERATRDANDALLAKIDTDFAAYDAQQNVIQAAQDYAEVEDDKETAVDEADQALKGYVRTILDQGVAVANMAEQQAIANGKMVTADEKQRIMIESLQMTAKTLAPNSPARKMLDQYIAALLRIPADVSTAIRLVGGLSTTGAGASAGASATHPGGMTPDGERTRSATVPGTTVVNVYPRVMPTEREITDLVNNTRRRQGGVI